MIFFGLGRGRKEGKTKKGREEEEGMGEMKMDQLI